MIELFVSNKYKKDQMGPIVVIDKYRKYGTYLSLIQKIVG